MLLQQISIVYDLNWNIETKNKKLRNKNPNIEYTCIWKSSYTKALLKQYNWTGINITETLTFPRQSINEIPGKPQSSL